MSSSRSQPDPHSDGKKGKEKGRDKNKPNALKGNHSQKRSKKSGSQDTQGLRRRPEHQNKSKNPKAKDQTLKERHVEQPTTPTGSAGPFAPSAPIISAGAGKESESKKVPKKLTQGQNNSPSCSSSSSWSYFTESDTEDLDTAPTTTTTTTTSATTSGKHSHTKQKISSKRQCKCSKCQPGKLANCGNTDLTPDETITDSYVESWDEIPCPRTSWNNRGHTGKRNACNRSNRPRRKDCRQEVGYKWWAGGKSGCCVADVEASASGDTTIPGEGIACATATALICVGTALCLCP